MNETFFTYVEASDINSALDPAYFEVFIKWGDWSIVKPKRYLPIIKSIVQYIPDVS